MAFPPTSVHPSAVPTRRVVNIVNFIRAEEPREPVDLFWPVREQMALVRKHGFPATWLLQYDALVSGPFADFLQREMAPDHEVGFWFEMNRRLCEDAGLPWRGNPAWGWDWEVPVAYLIGYTQAERRRLADTAVATFRRIFGRPLRSVACWNLDAHTLAHLAEVHGVDAFAVCRDQVTTDGFTIWGGPLAAYFPSRTNAWMPAGRREHQIPTPVFRLLGQDPVYAYDNHYRLRDGQPLNALKRPDTLEPAWPVGRDRLFVRDYLERLKRAPALALSYAQLGQENSFGWPEMAQAYPMQLEELARAAADGGLCVETMGATGARFKADHARTPPQAQVALADPFGFDAAGPLAGERSIWYESHAYRANLHLRGSNFYLRDLHVYTDRLPQPFLEDPVRHHGIEQRLPAALDGFHWSEDDYALNGGRRAAGRFFMQNASGASTSLDAAAMPVVREDGDALIATIPLGLGRELRLRFGVTDLAVKLHGAAATDRLELRFSWVPARSALTGVTRDALRYAFQGVAYALRVVDGSAQATPDGATIIADAHALTLVPQPEI